MRWILVLFLLGGCSAMSEKAQIAFFDAHKDKSGCVLLGGGAGGGAVVPAPTVPMAGGYGYAWAGWAAEGATVKIDKNGCEIGAK